MERAGAGELVLLVGFQNQPNLGIGYLAAALRAQGVDVRLLDVQEGRAAIVRAAVESRPILIGFSLIFQFYLSRYRDIVEALRRAGVTSHITTGGHFPSLCWTETLEALPGIDSVVRFEGEQTLLDLVETIHRGGDWHAVPGIAYRDSTGRPVSNPARPFIADLDMLPYPVREGPAQRVIGVETLPILASRGCARDCVFCSIRQFYRGAPGRVVRVRAADCVAAEIQELFDSRGARIYQFQDDDFPVWGAWGRRWVGDFADALARRGLEGEVIWKISCRVDEVEPELFAALRDAGLYLVYLGIESGTEAGLAALHKRTTVADNLRAARVLDRLGVLCQYGFMLLEPSSTFASVGGNLAFLRKLVAGGRRAVSFCRMVPYGGTEIRDTLVRERRLRGSVEAPGYTFLDPRLDDFFEHLEVIVEPWLGNDGLSYQLNTAWLELTTIDRLFPPLGGTRTYEHRLAQLTRRSNDLLLDLVSEAARAFEDDLGVPPVPDAAAPRAMLAELVDRRNAFVAANQDVLLESLREQAARGRHPDGRAREPQPAALVS